VDLSWSGGKATEAVLTASSTGERLLRPPKGQRIASIRAGNRNAGFVPDTGGIRVKLEESKPYRVVFGV
jgi:hypothetical protein